jgi:hypothetical protein
MTILPVLALMVSSRLAVGNRRRLSVFTARGQRRSTLQRFSTTPIRQPQFMRRMVSFHFLVSISKTTRGRSVLQVESFPHFRVSSIRLFRPCRG